MFRAPITLAIAASALSLAACQTAPKQTVLDLDTTDPLWPTENCVAARKAAHQYNDKPLVRAAAGVAGTAAAGPIAGAAATTALSAGQDDEREDLNNKILRACVSKPGTAPAIAVAPAPPPQEPAAQAVAVEPPPLAVPPADAASVAQPASTTEPAPAPQ